MTDKAPQDQSIEELEALAAQYDDGLGTKRGDRRFREHPTAEQQAQAAQQRAAREAAAKLQELRRKEEEAKEQKAIQEYRQARAVDEGNRALSVLANRSKEDVMKQIQLLYGAGSLALDRKEQAALALVTYNMGLDPSPGTGHLYAWKDRQGFHVQIGYRGWIFKAEQHYDFVYEVLPMNIEQSTLHGIRDEKGNVTAIGAVCKVYEMNNAQRWIKLGMEPRPIIGTGIANLNETPPKGRTLMWVAEKRATVDAIRHLGLGFGPATVQPIEGLDEMQFNAENDEYILPAEDSELEETKPEETVIEPVINGIFSEAATPDDPPPEPVEKQQAVSEESPPPPDKPKGPYRRKSKPKTAPPPDINDLIAETEDEPPFPDDLDDFFPRNDKPEPDPPPAKTAKPDGLDTGYGYYLDSRTNVPLPRGDEGIDINELPSSMAALVSQYEEAGRSTSRLKADELRQFHIRFSTFLDKAGISDKSKKAKSAFLKWLFNFDTSREMNQCHQNALGWWWQGSTAALEWNAFIENIYPRYQKADD